MMQPICLISESKEFHTVGVAKGNQCCQNVFVCSLGVPEFCCQKKGKDILCVCELRVDWAGKGRQA